MENNIIAVFNNRNNSMKFASYLKRLGITNRTINTPRELSTSCGLSVIFSYKDLNRVKEILYNSRLHLAVKLYIIKTNPIKKYIAI